MLPQVGVDQPWPYGLVDDEGSAVRWRLYCRCQEQQPFPSSLGGGREGEAGGGRCSLREHIQHGRCLSWQQSPDKIIHRAPFIAAVKAAIRSKGRLTLILHGKSVGKTLVVSHVADRVRQAPAGSRTILQVNMRQMPAEDFHEATPSVASESRDLTSVLWQIIKQVPVIASVLGVAEAGLAGALVPIAVGVQNLLKSLDDSAKSKCLAQLVNGIKKEGNDTAIMIDEANLALPNDEDPDEAKTAKTSWAIITRETREAFQASVILISSESTASHTSWPMT